VAVAEADVERLRARLYRDTPFWAAHCAKIADRRAQLVPLKPNGAQLKLEAALEAQREAGLPMRAIVLKARKLGFSTYVQAVIMHRITQRPLQRALVVAQDSKTAGELFAIGQRMWENLPADPVLGLKPGRMHHRTGRLMHFGEESVRERARANVGLDSKLEVDTANEVEAGRGFTYHLLHLSEVAFWAQRGKMLALLNAVPDEPDTMVVKESTANGANHFKVDWDRAVAGESEYAAVFAAWHEDLEYALAFRSTDEHGEFVEQIGEGAWGEDEPRLIAEFGCTPEQLNWRRKAIVDKCESDLLKFKQEYPASAEEAFIASGKHVFSMHFVSRVLDRVRQTDPDFISPDNPGPEIWELEPAARVPRRSIVGMVEVPKGAKWTRCPTPRRRVTEGKWRIWEHPDPGEDGARGERGRPPGAYVLFVDAAEGEETTSGEGDFHVIQIIDHRTKRQVAEYRSRIDPDLVAEQAFLAAGHYNHAVVAVEKTGGHGMPIVRKLWRDYRYQPLYKQKVLDQQKDLKSQDRIGWDTNRTTKPLMESGIMELLRESPEVFRSFLLAMELTTYVRDDRGRTGAEPDAHDDLLMAFAGAQQVAMEFPVPMRRGVTTTTSYTALGARG
jgi:hypothetical protein